MTPDQFDRLHREYHSRLIAFICTKNAHDAEDIAQEVWMKVFRAELTSQETAFAWIRTIAHRETLRHAAQRQAVKRGGNMQRQGFGNPIDRKARTPGERAANREAAQRAWNRMTADHRQIVASIFEGRTLAETAAQLGIPEGTVKSRLYNARKASHRDDAIADDRP